jgi:hypothetical protein
MDTPCGALCHVEIMVTDIPKGRDFYGPLFGWEFIEFYPGMDAFNLNGVHIGGLCKCETVEPGNSPSLWFKVANLDESIAKAKSLGATSATEKSEVPTVGWSATFCDPFGNIVGIVEYL